MQISSLQKYNFFFLLVVILLSGDLVNAQSFSEKADSLLRLLPSVETPTDRIDLLNNIAFEFRRSSPDSMLIYTQRALSLAEASDYDYGLMIANKNLGIYRYKLQSPTDSILSSYQRALDYAVKINDNYQQAALANNIALVKCTQNKFKESIGFLLNGLDKLKKSKESPSRLEALMNANLSASYRHLDDLEKAKLYLENAFAVAEKIGDATIPSIFGDDYGNILIGLGQEKQGMDHLLAITETQKDLHDFQSLCQTYVEIATQYLDQGKLERSKKFALLAEKAANTHGFTASLTRIDLVLAQIASRQSQHDTALKYGLAALESARYTAKYYEEKKAYRVLTEAYYNKGDYEAAFEMQNNFMAIQERIAETEKSILVEEMEAQFQLEEQQQQIALLNERQELQSWRFKILIIVSLLIVCLLLALMVAYLITRRSKMIISYKNSQLKDYIEQNLQLENFVHIASHDLKSPLRNITSFSQLLKRKIAAHPDKTISDYLYYIIKAGNEMSALVEDLLQYSIVNKKDVNRSEVDLGGIIDSLRESLRETILANDAVIESNLAHKNIIADPIKLKQVFQNLILNAIKFRHSDHSPIINITVTDQEDQWYFTVTDNGIGIEEQYQKQIFIVLKRLHTSNHYEGTGMGLAICKAIIEQHGGEIGVNSVFGQGSEFYFTIPKQTYSVEQKFYSVISNKVPVLPGGTTPKWR